MAPPSRSLAFFWFNCVLRQPVTSMYFWANCSFHKFPIFSDIYRSLIIVQLSRSTLTQRVLRISCVSLSALVSSSQLLDCQIISSRPHRLSSRLSTGGREVRTQWAHIGGRVARIQWAHIGGRAASRRSQIGGKGARRRLHIQLIIGGRIARRHWHTQPLITGGREARRRMGFSSYKWLNFWPGRGWMKLIQVRVRNKLWLIY